MSVYTVEETDDWVWSIIDENRGLYRGNGVVLDLQREEDAVLYCEMMNLVYDRVMKDVRGLTK